MYASGGAYYSCRATFVSIHSSQQCVNKILTARKSRNWFQIASVDVILLVSSDLLQALRLAPLDVESLSANDEFVERLLRRSFSSCTSRVLDECTLLAWHDCQTPHLTELVEVISMQSINRSIHQEFLKWPK